MPKSEQVEVESDFALNFLSSKLADFIGYLQEKRVAGIFLPALISRRVKCSNGCQ